MTVSADDVAASGPPVYFLLHLPKTAGQTLTGHLAAHCPSGTYLQPGRDRRLPRDPGDLARVRALSGHWLRRDMEAAFPGRAIRRTALLRDPVALQLSLYNFQMLVYEAKRLGTYSLDLHLAALPRNLIARFVLTRWLGRGFLEVARMSDAAQFAAIDAAFADFWFVGAHDRVGELIGAIATELGVPPVAAPRNITAAQRAFADFVPLRGETLDPAVAARIRRDHPVDQALWEKWGEGRAPGPLDDRPRGGDAVRRALADARRHLVRDWSRPGRIGQDRRVTRANAAFARGEWARAARLYRAALLLGGDSALLWIGRARSLRETGRFAAAAAAFDRALALKPDIPLLQQERDACAAFARD